MDWIVPALSAGAGLAEMHVDIHQSGAGDEAARVDDLGALLVDFGEG
ncbi:MAG: hypothetical protein BWX86_02837 [Verrucomicrobia bacterium ADurb.Bin122]|nr:MAG: hypothetical protein BWX86_02837 [Verrucomicrobia bacterium ADurb.Bin122]